jgi:enolase
MLVRKLGIRKIFATNSVPTIEVELSTKKGTVRSSVPIGTSVGTNEAEVLPADEAIRKFALISRYFRTESFDSQEDVDVTLRSIDKSPKFRNIGGNLALAISSAFLKAFAKQENMGLFEYVYKETKQKKPNMPIPMSNMVGGWHGQSDIQEFILIPVHQKKFSTSAALLSECYHKIAKDLKKEDTSFSYGKNLESAWTSSLNHETILRILADIANSNLMKMGLDVAASSMWNGERYIYKQAKFIRTEQLNFMEDLTKRFPICYIEDPFEEEDFVSHATLTHRLSNKNVMVCGDDLYTTNLYRLKKGIENKSTNAVIVKPNQVGTITDTIRFVEEARKNNIKTVMSHRSGETEDTLICHLAVGLGCDYIKLGISGERTAKINEMIRIEGNMV